MEFRRRERESELAQGSSETRKEHEAQEPRHQEGEDRRPSPARRTAGRSSQTGWTPAGRSERGKRNESGSESESLAGGNRLLQPGSERSRLRSLFPRR